MQLVTDINLVDRSAWNALAKISATASWFQTPAAYDFFASLPDLMTPFFFAVQHQGELKGVVVGYVTHEKNALKQFLTRRAIINGGPMLSDSITSEELELLLNSIRKNLSSRAIYIETRNFNDYSTFRPSFEKCGFTYEPHYDFHINTSTEELVEQNLGKNRKRDIKTSFRDGVQVIENPTLSQVKDWYGILDDLYTTKVKTPLFPWCFFEQLYKEKDTCYLLVEFENRIIGGTLCMSLDGISLYEWFVCGEDGVHKNIFPSSVATYAGMHYAVKTGCSRFDMMGAGVPGVAYGVRDFKARFGGELKELGRYMYISKPLLYRIGSLGVKILKRK